MFNTQSLSGEVAVVTGGASGIGRALAARLVRLGMQVVIADIEAGALNATATEIGAVGVRTDVSKGESVQALADAVQKRYGTVRLFCSNAGVASVARLTQMTPADWDWLLGVNLWGTLHGIRAFLPLLRASPHPGQLVITASEAGFHAAPDIGGYSVSKAAVVAAAETLALELALEGSPVGTTLLCPGPVRSHLGASQRNRPQPHAPGALVDADLEHTDQGRMLRWLEPDAVVDALLSALEAGRFYVFTHPDMAAAITDRHEQIARALAQARPAVP